MEVPPGLLALECTTHFANVHNEDYTRVRIHGPTHALGLLCQRCVFGVFFYDRDDNVCSRVLKSLTFIVWLLLFVLTALIQGNIFIPDTYLLHLGADWQIYIDVKDVGAVLSFNLDIKIW